MRLPSPEALTISAVLNNADLSPALHRGLSPDHFNGYRSEFEFLLNYTRQYHDLPSPDVLTGSFPDFPYRPTARETEFYADQTIARHNQRLVKQAMVASAERLAAGDPAASLAIMRDVKLVATRASTVDAVRSHCVDRELDAESEPSVAYPWASAQRITGGMRPGDFVVYGARSGIGKSWSLAYTACAAAQAGLHVRYLSLEMPAHQLVERVHTILGNQLGYRLSHSALHQKTVDRILYRRLLCDLHNKVPGRIDVIDSANGRITPTVIGNNGQVDLVIIDYLQLMSAPDGRRAVDDWRVMASISNQCKEEAMSLNAPVLAAAQLNREGARIRMQPTIAELAQSDAIGQDADFVLMQRRMHTGPVMVNSVAKNRHGLTDGVVFWTKFDPDYGQFREIDKQTAEDLCDDDPG